jgi:hypothetical protein
MNEKPEKPLHPAIRRGCLRRHIAAHGHGPEGTIEAAAYRSAATACVLATFGATPPTLSLTDDGAMFLPPTSQSAAEEIAVALLAGGYAVRRYVPPEQRDLAEATARAAKILKPYTGSLGELQGIMRQLLLASASIVYHDAQFWREVEALATELLAQLRLSAEDIGRVIDGVRR